MEIQAGKIRFLIFLKTLEVGSENYGDFYFKLRKNFKINY